MNDPQIWTLIGVFSALMIASNRYTVVALRAEIRAGDAALGERLGGRIDALGGRIDGLGGRIDGLSGQLNATEKRLDEKIDAKHDHLAEVLGIRLDSVDHRLGAVEDDLKIVKAHLLRHPAA